MISYLLHKYSDWLHFWIIKHSSVKLVGKGLVASKLNDILAIVGQRKLISHKDVDC